MDLAPHEIPQILGKLQTGKTVEELAGEYKVSTGIIDVVRAGKYRFADGTKQKPISPQVITGSPTKCTKEEIDEICARFLFGDSSEDLAREFGVASHTIRTYVEKRGHRRDNICTLEDTPIVQKFVSQVRKRLWRFDSSPEKPAYHEWLAGVQKFFKTGKYTKAESHVLASKEYDCCRDLFEEFDVSEHDPTQEGWNTKRTPLDPILLDKNAPGGDSFRPVSIKCEHRELSYRANLQWAIDAIGRFRRTEMQPDTCPNDTAYFLFLQGVNDPKEFMSKVNSVEMKTVTSREDENIRKFSQRSISEIDVMLKALGEEE